MEPQENSAAMSAVLVLSCCMCVNVLYFKMSALVIPACPCASAKQLLPKGLRSTGDCYFFTPTVFLCVLLCSFNDAYFSLSLLVHLSWIFYIGQWIYFFLFLFFCLRRKVRLPNTTVACNKAGLKFSETFARLFGSRCVMGHLPWVCHTRLFGPVSLLSRSSIAVGGAAGVSPVQEK